MITMRFYYGDHPNDDLVRFSLPSKPAKSRLTYQTVSHQHDVLYVMFLSSVTRSVASVRYADDAYTSYGRRDVQDMLFVVTVAPVVISRVLLLRPQPFHARQSVEFARSHGRCHRRIK